MIEALGAATEVVESERGRAEIWHPRSSLVLTRVTGHFDMAQAEAIMRTVDQAIAQRRGKVSAVHDWTDVESYQVLVHARMSAWSLSVVGSMERIVVGVRSPLVALAVRTANLASGNRFELHARSESIQAAARQLLG